MIRLLIVLPILASLMGLTCGCTPHQPQGARDFLIVFVPNLRVDDLSCGSASDVPLTETPLPHIEKLCAESVRFTHAYTPSLLSNSVLASVLTGLYPYEHGIRRNDGSNWTLDNPKLISTELHSRGYWTALISGGPPFFRKAVVTEGFDDLDDSVRLQGAFFRRAGDSVLRFFTLLDNHADGRPFFAVLAFADLEFPSVAVTDQILSPTREGGVGGRLQDIDAAIGVLEDELEERHLWDPTTIILASPNGRVRGEHDETPHGINLYDEVVHVPLVIKPSRKPADLHPTWKVDEPVTLVDLGPTLADLAGIKPPYESQADARDLTAALHADAFETSDRLLYTESDLLAWRGWGPRLVAARSGEYVFWPDPEPSFFSTLTDRLELHNVFAIDRSQAESLQNQASRIFSEMRGGMVVGRLTESMGEKLKLARRIFAKEVLSASDIDALRELSARRPQDWQVVQWLAQTMIARQDWPGLRLLGRDRPPPDVIAQEEWNNWQVLAALKLRLKAQSLWRRASGCVALALSLKVSGLRGVDKKLQICRQEEVQLWLRAYAASKKKKNKEASELLDAARAITERRVQQEAIARLFWVDSAVWDFRADQPAGPALIDIFSQVWNDVDFTRFLKASH